jgi:hypothetical protein
MVTSSRGAVSAKFKGMGGHLYLGAEKVKESNRVLCLMMRTYIELMRRSPLRKS